MRLLPHEHDIAILMGEVEWRGIPKEEAAADLRTFTGQDFGLDGLKWKRWFEDDPTGTRVQQYYANIDAATAKLKEERRRQGLDHRGRPIRKPGASEKMGTSE